MKRFGILFDMMWLPVFLLLSVSWLFAPMLHHVHYGNLQVISHYEAIDQAWNWLFRLCDVLAAAVLATAIWRFKIVQRRPWTGVLLYVVTALAAIDAFFPIGCHGACTQLQTLSHTIHDSESAFGAVVILGLAFVELWRRRHWLNVLFLCAQLGIGLLAASGIASHSILMVLEFVYEVLIMAWLGWAVLDFSPGLPPLPRVLQKFLPRAFGIVTLLGGVFVIVVAIPHRHLWGPFLDFTITPNSLRLAQHGIAAGVLLLYISRHVGKGQRRAAALLAFIFVTFVFKYSLLQPHFGLLLGSLLLLIALVVARSTFTRNTAGASPLVSRLQDLGIVFVGVLTALSIVVLISVALGKQQVLRRSVSRAYRHDTSLLVRREDRFPERREHQLSGVFNALGISFIAVVLWSLFRPSVRRLLPTTDDRRLATDICKRYATSSEDFFKLWPEGKQYFFNRSRTGFVAYKLTGSIAFAIADPIAPPNLRQPTLDEFIDFCHGNGWSVCFLLVSVSSRRLYEQGKHKLKCIQIGSSAVIDVGHFVNTTQREKWWRWQYNRAQRTGSVYQTLTPPHSSGLLAEMREVSDAWLKRDGRGERGFMLGYFDDQYLQQCALHLLRNADGRLVAFTNELPVYGSVSQRTVDLIRFLPDVDGAMPTLLLYLLRHLRECGVASFDLGFVPLARLDSALAGAAKRLAKSRFSAAGLEQFKGKFRPDWHANFIAYDGDLVDLARLLAALDGVFKLPD